MTSLLKCKITRIVYAHDRDCDIVAWEADGAARRRGQTHEFVWSYDALRKRCAVALEGVLDQDDRNEIIVGMRTKDAFGYDMELEYSPEQRDAFAAILLAGEVQRAYWFASACRTARGEAPNAAFAWRSVMPSERT